MRIIFVRDHLEPLMIPLTITLENNLKTCQRPYKQTERVDRLLGTLDPKCNSLVISKTNPLDKSNVLFTMDNNNGFIPTRSTTFPCLRYPPLHTLSYIKEYQSVVYSSYIPLILPSLKDRCVVLSILYSTWQL